MPKRTPAANAVVLLSQRTLNRTLLERQCLLRRVRMPVADLIEHLVGMQAQVPNNPYVASWSRLEEFDPLQLSDLIESRGAVRLALLRATLHLVTARDALALRPVLRETLKRLLMTGSPFGRQLAGVDLEVLVAAGKELVESQPRTYAQLGAELGPRWPDHDANALTYGVHYLSALVQVPPRGLWQRGGVPMTTTLEHWLGRPLNEDTSPDATVLRYLTAFGPATPADAQYWSGIQGMREIFERLRPRFRVFRDEANRELFDVIDAPIAKDDASAPVRFLPEYDNVLLGHADRTRIVSEANRKRISRLNGFSAAVLIDGFVGGLWKIVTARKSSTMQIELFDALISTQRTELESEAEALLAFMTPKSTERHLDVLTLD